MRSLRHGRANRWVKIEQPTNTTDTSGQVLKTWSTYRTVWAERMYNKGFDDERNQRFEVATNYKYRFDGWDSNLTTSMRLNDRDKYYYIHNIEPLGQDQGTILYVDGRDHNEFTE